MNNHSWENNSNLMEPWIDTQSQDTETSSEFSSPICLLYGEDESKSWVDEGISRGIMCNHKDGDNGGKHQRIECAIPTMAVPIVNTDEYHFEEPQKRDGHLELFYDSEPLREEGKKDLTIEEESQEEVYSAQQQTFCSR